MPYRGSLQRGVAFTIDGSTSLTGSTGMTITKINQRGGVHSTPMTFPAGATFSIPEILGARIVRVIVHVHLPDGGLANILVVQGIQQWSDQCAADTELVWDAVP